MLPTVASHHPCRAVPCRRASCRRSAPDPSAAAAESHGAALAGRVLRHCQRAHPGIDENTSISSSYSRRNEKPRQSREVDRMYPTEEETALWVAMNLAQRSVYRAMDAALKARGLPPLRRRQHRGRRTSAHAAGAGRTRSGRRRV